MPVSISGTGTISAGSGQSIIFGSDALAAVNFRTVGVSTLTNIITPITVAEPAGTRTANFQFNGNNWKHLGLYQFRADSQYLDLKTNVSANSFMYIFHVCGYLYNSGEVISYTSGYCYTPPSSILNQYTHNLGNQSISTYRTAGPAGGGFLCLKANRGSSGYSEGYLNVYIHTWNENEQNSVVITAYAQNNTAGNFYTS